MNKHGMLTIYIPVKERSKVERFKELVSLRQQNLSYIVLSYIDDYLREPKKYNVEPTLFFTF